MASNQRNISQAQNTPFMQEPLSSELGWVVVGSVMQDILNGAYVASAVVSAFTLDLISGLARNDKAKLDKLLEIGQGTNLERLGYTALWYVQSGSTPSNRSGIRCQDD
jgi:hypothetical protein